MGSAKDILVKVIPANVANALVRRVHYSGKSVNNSQLHFGCFLDNRLHGVMSFGPPLDKRKVLPLVAGTLWNEMLELNRMAFDETLPRNSESRALAVAFRLIRRHAPHVKWILSFADGAQCGDGAIYRAAGFVLTSIKKNNSIWEAPTGDKFNDHAMRGVDHNTNGQAKALAIVESLRGARESRTSLTDNRSKREQARAVTVVRDTTVTKGEYTGAANGGASMKQFIEAGFKPIEGFQLRYIYFLDPTARERLTVPVLPFSEIERRGVRMYKGQRLGAASIGSDAPGHQPGEGGAEPTAALQN